MYGNVMHCAAHDRWVYGYRDIHDVPDPALLRMPVSYDYTLRAERILIEG